MASLGTVFNGVAVLVLRVAVSIWLVGGENAAGAKFLVSVRNWALLKVNPKPETLKPKP